MKFDPSDLRSDADNPLPYRDRIVTLVHVAKNGKVASDHTISGKKEILESYQSGDLLMAAWTGQYRTDMFSVAVKRVRDAIGAPKPQVPTEKQLEERKVRWRELVKILESVPCPNCEVEAGQKCSPTRFKYHAARHRVPSVRDALEEMGQTTFVRVRLA